MARADDLRAKIRKLSAQRDQLQQAWNDTAKRMAVPRWEQQYLAEHGTIHPCGWNLWKYHNAKQVAIMQQLVDAAKAELAVRYEGNIRSLQAKMDRLQAQLEQEATHAEQSAMRRRLSVTRQVAEESQVQVVHVRVR